MRKILLSLCTFVVFGLLANLAVAQNPDPARKWIPAPPSTLGTGYYVVDSYDAANAPWRPTYSFNDTLYQYKLGLWNHIANGPRSFIVPPGQKPPVYWHNIGGDTTNNTFAGPIPIGFNFNFYGNDYDSVYLSSNGYIGFGGYARASGSDGPSYATNKVATAFPNSQLPKNIAAFMMTDGFLVHGNTDSSMAYFKTSLSNDTLYISLYNYFFTNAALSSTNGAFDKIRMDVQIVLTRSDSSITFMYRKFYGIVNCGLFAYQAAQLFRAGGDPGCNLGNAQYASMIGVQDSVWSQGTTYMANGGFTSSGPNADMADAMAVKFKRWPNICQADTIVFPPRNYELLVGDSLFPIAVYGNVSQIPQTFYCIFRIRSLLTGFTVYQARDSVNNLAGGKTQRIYFPPWYTYTQFNDQVGPMFVEAIASPYKNIDQFIGDFWPFDDTLRQEMFVVKQVEGFEDFNNDFSNPVLLPGTIPDALLWVNINANVVDGDNFTYNPPPPRGLQGDPNGTQLNSPVILMDRRDANGFYYDQCLQGVGDTIISFPIDLHTMKHALLGFSYERAGKLNYPRWYDLSSALGPERTVTAVGDPNAIYRFGDSLTVEYASRFEITNVQSWTPMLSIDGGKDFNFNRVYLPVDSPMTGSYFRFRVRLKEKDDFVPGQPTDDADAWYLDNFVVSSPVKPEIEVSYVRFTSDWPYLSVPASQATSVPIEASIANNGGSVAQSFGLNILVYPVGGARYIDTTRKLNIPLPVFNELITIPALPSGQTLLINGGKWNARQAGPGQYNLVAQLEPKNYDAESANDSTYNTVTMQFGDSYTYDDGTNDIPGDFGLAGLGLSMQELPPFADPAGGVNGGDLVGVLEPGGSGTIAVKFKVFTADTIYGANVWFGSFNQANDPIRIVLYHTAGTTPGDTLANGCTLVNTTRQAPWDNFSTYLFDCGPVVLQPGEYWLGVSQLGETGFEIGGNASRSSVDWLAYDGGPNEAHILTMNYPELNNRFAFENTALSGIWYSFYYPAGVGKPGYAYPTPSTAFSRSSNVCLGSPGSWNYFVGQGSWIPMIRPYFGRRTFGPRQYLPIELSSFNGQYISNYIALAWKTESEVNNTGFYIERRTEGNAAWSTLNTLLIPGYGTTTQPHDYSYNDQNIVLGTTYQYRLRQVDNDGEVHYSNTVEITTPPADFYLAQNYPNPFNASTQISYTLPSSGNVTLKIYDMLGREIKTLSDGYQSAQTYSIIWDGKDNGGTDVPSGAYSYKMTVNGRTFSHTLILTR
ncbi:MAG TPA: FlgD immunoglobulin-like domain containing protein [Candidatus Kapabacteria bacterium]|nr:FlgD immunoglobulin-like domain containing protein [Candidatus Kapabacteria bacterium]